MSILDLNDPVKRAEAIRTGLVWYAPDSIQLLAVQDLADGRVPMPSYPLPQWPAARLHEMTGGRLPADTTNDAAPSLGSGPA